MKSLLHSNSSPPSIYKAMFLALMALLTLTSQGSLTDDWNEVQSLIQEMLADMQAIDTQWTGVADNITGSISQMANRIVYTEGLIDDMGDQIGVMSGRIVATEYLMANLTAKCMHCEVTMDSEPVNLDKVARPVRKLEAVSELPLEQDGSFSSLVQFMNFTIAQMMSASTQMSGLFDTLDAQIGVMADRIVVTECLIMNMSLQIGDMADRIVYTEELMKNATEVCCNVAQADLDVNMKGIKQHYPVNCYGHGSGEYKPRHFDNPLNRHLEKLQSAILKIAITSEDETHFSLLGIPPFNPLNPISWMIASMELGEEVMMKMFNATMNITNESITEIGSLADQIVEMEDNIMTTAGYIGQVSDCIVEVEAMMTGWAQDLCKGITPKRYSALCPQIQLPAIRTPKLFLSKQIHKPDFSLSAWNTEAKTKYGEVILDIYNDMVSFVNLMDSMLTSMVDVFNSMLDTENHLANDIMETVGLIERMEQEIQTMVGKIMETISLMDNLQKDCFEY